MRIDTSIDALCDALVAAGVDGPRGPADAALLDQVEAAIAPLRLPPQLRAFWQRIDPATLKVLAFPQPIGPAFAYDTWKQHREEFPGLASAALILVGCESWNCMSVELDSPLGEGGALFEWRLDGSDFYLRYHQLSDWLDHITALLREGAYERREGVGRRVLYVRDPEAGMALAAPRRPLPPHARYGDASSIARSPRHWPDRWQRLSGIQPDDLKPHGATHTVAELLASNPETRLDATIAGRVVDLGSFGSTTRARVSDGTAEIAINCPAAVTSLGPVCGHEFEFDLVVPPGPRRAAVDLATLHPVEDPVGHISQQLMARYGGPAAAVATGIRRIEDT